MLATSPFAVDLFVCHNSELSDAERIFLMPGTHAPRVSLRAPLGEPQAILTKNADRSNLTDSGNQPALPLCLRQERRIITVLRFLITVRTIDKERGLLRSIYLAQKPGSN